jgi:hypothetical protein
MLDLNDIHPVTDFNRNTKEHIQRLKQTGKPEVLTVNGQAEIVVQSARGVSETARGSGTCPKRSPGFDAGLEQAKRGEGRPMREFHPEACRETRPIPAIKHTSSSSRPKPRQTLGLRTNTLLSDPPPTPRLGCAICTSKSPDWKNSPADSAGPASRIMLPRKSGRSSSNLTGLSSLSTINLPLFKLFMSATERCARLVKQRLKARSDLNSARSKDYTPYNSAARAPR